MPGTVQALQYKTQATQAQLEAQQEAEARKRIEAEARAVAQARMTANPAVSAAYFTAPKHHLRAWPDLGLVPAYPFLSFSCIAYPVIL